MGRVSAYFVFTRQAREGVKARLLTEGSKAAVTDVAKALGERWRSLSEEERAAYKRQAKEEADAAAAQAPSSTEAGGGASEGGGEGGVAADDGGASAPSPALPLARVSRIMKLDPDVTRFSKEALLLTAVATEAFLEGLTDHAAAAAKTAGRRTIKVGDVADVCARRENDRLHFLVDVMRGMAQAAAAAQPARQGDGGRRASVAPGAEGGEEAASGERGGEGVGEGKAKSMANSKAVAKGKEDLAVGTKSVAAFFTRHKGPAPAPEARPVISGEWAAYEADMLEDDAAGGADVEDEVLADDDEEMAAAAAEQGARTAGRAGRRAIIDEDDSDGEDAPATAAAGGNDARMAAADGANVGDEDDSDAELLVDITAPKKSRPSSGTNQVQPSPAS